MCRRVHGRVTGRGAFSVLSVNQEGIVQALIIESVWLEDAVVENAGLAEIAQTWDAAAEDAENALKWLASIGSGVASGAATGAVGGPWGALVGGLVGGGLGAVQAAQRAPQQRMRPSVAPSSRPTSAAPDKAAAAPVTTPPPAATAPATPPPFTGPLPASGAPAPPAGSVNAADVANMLTTLTPLLVALGQQLATGPTPTAVVEGAAHREIDAWPVDDDAAPQLSTSAEPSESTECGCWDAEEEWSPDEPWLTSDDPIGQELEPEEEDAPT